MSKKTMLQDPFQPKITRNDRFAQMSHQEKVIEQKKRELQAKREATQKCISDVASTTAAAPVAPAKHAKSSPKVTDVKKTAGFNTFNNDGSFLDNFKSQMKEKRSDSKGKSFKSKESYEKSYSDQRGNKNSRWSQKRRSPSPKGNTKQRISRFSDKSVVFEPVNTNKITINTHSFNSPIQSQHSFDQQQHQIISPQNVTGQPLLKNILPPPGIVYPAVTQNSSGVIAAPPLLLNVPPPQMVQNQVNPALLLPNPATNVLVSTPAVVTMPASTGVLTTVTLPPPPIQTIAVPTSNNTISVPPPTVELTSIPPPNPIQVQNIPQPEPINALNIPHPAPIQVQNIPTPTSIQLNEIPNPKPLDLLTIPTPNEENTKPMSDPDFIKNIPPPNKSVPPPSLSETNISVPPPGAAAISLPPPIITASIPPPVSQPLPQNLTVQTMTAPCQNILVHTLPPPQPVPPQIQTIQSLQTTQSIQNVQTGVPPPSLQVGSISVALPVGVVPSSPVSVNTTIPSLMAQPILPPPGMGVAAVNVTCPPPLLHMNAASNPTAMQAPPPPPSFVNHPPPITNQMPPMNIPPPQTAMPMLGASTSMTAPCRDMNAVFPPGTSDYEKMVAVGQIVAQCGTSIEDVLMQRKPLDPNLWFLFHKESAAYQQYKQIVEKCKRDISESSKESIYKPEDLYEPEMPIDDDSDFVKQEIKQEMEFDEAGYNKRKRKSRWGDKQPSVPPPTVVLTKPLSNVPHMIAPIQPVTSGGPMMLSKVTRTDSGLLQYASNTYGSTNLSDEEWKKAEDHYKINLLYQDMLKKKEECEKLQQAGKHKYDYDSDEDVEGGTWEHKLRDKEMMATQLWAQELTRQAEGKHHIGDFLPPDEYKRFMEKTNANKEGRTPNFSDYKEFKIKEDNIGFQLLQKLGWTEGQGLGSNGSGIIEPINKSGTRDHQGLGLGESESDKEDEYEAYRKRMMLAYRFRPNPLNNPRRPYY